MKIQKYVKDKQNKYKVVIEDEEYLLYDDIIIKYGLLLNKDISEKEFKEMLSENEHLKSYYDSIKYINKKLRSEKEIRDYLLKKGVSLEVISTTINKLKETKYLDDELYFKAFLNDQLNLSNNGPKKIANSLLKLGFREDVVKEKIEEIDGDIWDNKINNYIDKKIKLNHNSSSNMLKIKITNDLINLGYDKELIVSILSKYQIEDSENLKKEYLKIKKTLERKYTGYELNQKIKEKLYRKGFTNINLEELEDEE